MMSISVHPEQSNSVDQCRDIQRCVKLAKHQPFSRIKQPCRFMARRIRFWEDAGQCVLNDPPQTQVVNRGRQYKDQPKLVAVLAPVRFVGKRESEVVRPASGESVIERQRSIDIDAKHLLPIPVVLQSFPVRKDSGTK